MSECMDDAFVAMARRRDAIVAAMSERTTNRDHVCRSDEDNAIVAARRSRYYAPDAVFRAGELQR